MYADLPNELAICKAVIDCCRLRYGYVDLEPTTLKVNVLRMMILAYFVSFFLRSIIGLPMLSDFLSSALALARP